MRFRMLLVGPACRRMSLPKLISPVIVMAHGKRRLTNLRTELWSERELNSVICGFTLTLVTPRVPLWVFTS